MRLTAGAVIVLLRILDRLIVTDETIRNTDHILASLTDRVVLGGNIAQTWKYRFDTDDEVGDENRRLRDLAYTYIKELKCFDSDTKIQIIKYVFTFSGPLLIFKNEVNEVYDVDMKISSRVKQGVCEDCMASYEE